MAVLTLKNLKLEMGGNLLFEADKLTVEHFDIIGLIGKNGAGKTSLLKIMSGEIKDYSGDIYGKTTVIFRELKFTDDIIKSGGEEAINNFLTTLRKSASLFLLDEPTTYLDQNNFDKVVSTIKRSNSTFCIASHDRLFLEKVATKIWLIEQGKIKVYNCTYNDYLQERLYEKKHYKNDLKKYRLEKKKIKETLQSMKKKREQKKSKPKKISTSEYRIAGTKTKINTKQKKLQKEITKQQLKLEQLKQPERIEEEYDISFLSKASNLPKRKILIPEYNAIIEGKSLWNIANITLESGDKIGVIGANGSGKTTFLNYLMITFQDIYKIGYFKQSQENLLNKEDTVLSVIKNSVEQNLERSQIQTLLAFIDFKGDKVFRKIHQLSKGELAKVTLLSFLVSDLDILLLDEITNYFDMETIEAVEKVLKVFHGILVFVSHDTYFTRNLANRILNIEDYKE